MQPDDPVTSFGPGGLAQLSLVVAFTGVAMFLFANYWMKKSGIDINEVAHKTRNFDQLPFLRAAFSILF